VPALVAFLSGVLILGLVIAAFIAVTGPPPSEAEQRQLARETAPPGSGAWCAGENLQLCLSPLPEVPARSWSDCQRAGDHVCLVTIGAVDQRLIDDLVSYFREKYELEVLLGPAIALPEIIQQQARLSSDFNEYQPSTQALVDYLTREMSAAKISTQAMIGLTLIGITAMDVHAEHRPERQYVLGNVFHYKQNGATYASSGIVSYHRMDDRVYGHGFDDEQLKARLRKLVSNHIGQMHYGLEESSDRRSAMYEPIRTPQDLDRMSDTLPLPGR
jgi:predicted Zn-dependent protease